MYIYIYIYAVSRSLSLSYMYMRISHHSAQGWQLSLRSPQLTRHEGYGFFSLTASSDMASSSSTAPHAVPMACPPFPPVHYSMMTCGCLCKCRHRDREYNLQLCYGCHKFVCCRHCWYSHSPPICHQCVDRCVTVEPEPEPEQS